MELGIIGTSIWQQNLPLMERLTLDRETKVSELQRIKDSLGLSELVYLATCNRVEFMYVSDSSLSDTQLFHKLLDFFFEGKKDIGFFPNDFFFGATLSESIWFGFGLYSKKSIICPS